MLQDNGIHNLHQGKEKIEQLQEKALKEISPFSRSKLSKEMFLVNRVQFMQL